MIMGLLELLSPQGLSLSFNKQIERCESMYKLWKVKRIKKDRGKFNVSFCLCAYAFYLSVPFKEESLPLPGIGPFLLPRNMYYSHNV